MSITLSPPESGTLPILPWSDEVVDAVGHDPRSDYVEHYWLAVLGPSAVWLLRHVAHRFDDDPGGFELELGTTARQLGLAHTGGRNSPFWRTVNRCVQFRVARSAESGLAVRRRLPPLTQRQIARLPELAQRDHDRWQLRARRGRSGPLPIERAKLVAVALVDRGEGYHEVHHQLRRWGLPRPMALAVTDWAFERLGVQPPGSVLPPASALPPGSVLPPAAALPAGSALPPASALPPGSVSPPAPELPPPPELASALPPASAPVATPECIAAPTPAAPEPDPADEWRHPDHDLADT